MARWTDEHVRALHEDGFVLIPGFLSPEEVAAGMENMLHYYPTPEQYFSALGTDENAWLEADAFAGLIDFPFTGDALNHQAMHPDLMAFAEAFLGIHDIRLIQTRIWAKFGGGINYDQQLHMDYRNHTLVFPRDDGGFGELEAFLYYADVTIDSGPTYVLSRKHTRDLPLDIAVLDRTEHADLYAHEVPAVGPAGTLMAYTPATFHRGSALGPPPNARYISGVAYRGAGLEWIGHQSWPYAANKPDMGRFIVQASLRQREVLGIPVPGHPYWNELMIAGVEARYPGIDMTPYRDALADRA